jgi:hypothetical protein
MIISEPILDVKYIAEHYSNKDGVLVKYVITNADKIEEVDFAMVEDSKGDLHYSAHRHDYKVLDSGKMIDGGRSYVRTNGLVKRYIIKNGMFVEPLDADWNWQDSGIENFD